MAKNYSITTTHHFEVFKKEFLKWVDFWGLKGWAIEFGHTINKDARASIAWRLTGRIAFVQLSREWEQRDSVITDNEVRKSAFHESCELLMGRLEMMASGKTQNNKDCVEEEIHNVIRTLENVVFKPHNRKGQYHA